MTLFRLNFCIATVLALAFCSAPSAAQGIDEAQLQVLLEETRSEKKIPGLRAAVRYGDGRIVRAAVGVADKDSGSALDDSIGMPGGSTGKTFVAALAMMLVEDGALGLDDLVARWVGDTDWFRRLPNHETMKVRHLLSHSSGLKDYPATMRFQLAMIRRVLRHGSARFEPEELIAMVRGRRALFPPGEGFRYTDAGYLVLGRVIEAASGASYYDLLARKILGPLELDHVRPSNTSVLIDVATGYTGGSSVIRDDGTMKFDPSSEWTGGGLITNPTMLVEFLGALAEGRIVSEDSLAKMLNGGWQDPKTPAVRYGFGLLVYDDGRSFGHAGRWPGYRTHVAHFRDSGRTIAVQANRDGRLDLQGLVLRIIAAM